MKTVTAAFKRTVRSSHMAVFRGTACDTYQTTTTPVGVDVPILGGAATLDFTADYWATLDCTVSGVGAWPLRPNASLAPYGNELYVERGIRYGYDENDNPIEEWVGLGYFRIEELGQDLPGDGPITILANDRWAGIVEARLEQPRQIFPSDTYGAAVSGLVLEVYPDAVIEWDDDSDLLIVGRTVVFEVERGDALRDLVAALGKIIHFNDRGALVIRSLPSEWTEAFTVTSGANGVYVGMSRKLTRTGVFNAVIATGEGADDIAPVWGAAYNMSSASPTRYGGRFGKVPRFYSSPLLLTDDQAAAAARTILAKGSGLTYSVNFSTIVNPALEPYDVGRVRYSARYGDERHMIQAVTIPLTAGESMTATTRQRTVVLT